LAGLVLVIWEVGVTLGCSPRDSRRVRNVLDPVAATVYFARESHLAFGELGFPLPTEFDSGSLVPLNPEAYMVARAACFGDVAAGVVTAAFGVFPHAVVQKCLTRWRSRVRYQQVQRARSDAAIAALQRQIGPASDGMKRAAELSRRAVDALSVAGKPVFAALREIPFRDEPVFDLWHAADLYREHRGDSHVAAWTSHGLSAPQACLINDLTQGLGLKTYVRTRGWNDTELDAAAEDLMDRGLIVDSSLSDDGKKLRESIESATDRQQIPAVVALGDDLPELCDLVAPYRAAIVQASGYPGRSALEKLNHWQTTREGQN
jgi:hypothetical protein